MNRQRSAEMLLGEGPQARFSRSQQISLSAEQPGCGWQERWWQGVMAMGNGRTVTSGITYGCDAEEGRIF